MPFKSILTDLSWNSSNVNLKRLYEPMFFILHSFAYRLHPFAYAKKEEKSRKKRSKRKKKIRSKELYIKGDKRKGYGENH